MFNNYGPMMSGMASLSRGMGSALGGGAPAQTSPMLPGYGWTAPGAARTGGGGVAEINNAFFGSGPTAAPVSDRNAKSKKKAAPVESFLEHLKPYTYKYKDPGLEPTDSPTGGDYLGVMAQDVERSPTGKQIVKEDGTGLKHLEMGPLMSAMAAGLGYLHQRVKSLEGK